jgi:hypothetical protein
MSIVLSSNTRVSTVLVLNTPVLAVSAAVLTENTLADFIVFLACDFYSNNGKFLGVWIFLHYLFVTFESRIVLSLITLYLYINTSLPIKTTAFMNSVSVSICNVNSYTCDLQ